MANPNSSHANPCSSSMNLSHASPNSSTAMPSQNSAHPSSSLVDPDFGSSHDVVKSNSTRSSLFSSGKDAQFHYHQPQFSNGKHSVFISKSVHNQGISVWEDCLVEKSLGSSPLPFSQIQAIARKIWERRDRVDVIPLENEVFLFNQI